jgi:CHAT domain-containing protein/tetratricopeptide (TPR) repeat protein
MNDRTPQEAQVIEAVLAFLRAETWPESKRVVQVRREELLSGAADEVLGTLIDQADDPDTRRFLAEHRDLLARCRRDGIDSAFARLLPPEVADFVRAASEAIGARTSAELGRMVQDRPEQFQLVVDMMMGMVEAPEELRPTIEGVLRLTQPSEMPRRIELCRAALSRVDRERQTKLWAYLQAELGTSLAQDVSGDRAENLERAIGPIRAALRVWSSQEFPWQWAYLNNLLGIIYRNRTRGDRAANLERSIRSYRRALRVPLRQLAPDQWAMTRQNLAIAYAFRIRGIPAANQERALRHCRAALREFTFDRAPEGWASVHFNMAGIYAARERGEPAENYRRAIRQYRAALRFFTRSDFPDEWAMIQTNLGNIYLERPDGARAGNVARALTHLQRGLRGGLTRESSPDSWSKVQYNLGVAHAELSRDHGEAHWIRAIEHFRRALEVRTPGRDPGGRLRTLRSLGDLHFEHGDWADAAEIFGEAMRVSDLLLAAAYTDHGRQFEVGESARLHARAAYCLLKLGWPGEALLRLERGRARLLARAMALADADLAGLPEHRREELVQLRAELRDIEAALRQARREIPGTELEVDRRVQRAGREFQGLIAVLERQPDFVPTPEDLDLMLGPEGYVDALPDLLRSPMRAWHRELRRAMAASIDPGHPVDPGEAEATRARLTRALDGLLTALGEYIAAGAEAGVRHPYAESLRQSFLQVRESLAAPSPTAPEEQPGAAGAAARRPAPDGAPVRAALRGFAEAVRDLTGDGPAADAELTRRCERAWERLRRLIEEIRAEDPGFMSPELDLATLLRLPEPGELLIAPVFTSRGSAVLFLPHGVESMGAEHVLWLNDLTEREIQTFLSGPPEESTTGGWLGAYFRHHFGDGPDEEWRSSIDDQLGQLGAMLVGPIRGHAASRGAERLVVIPQGGLQLLPLHAAWSEVDGRCRYLLDDYEVGYAPSIFALAACRRRASRCGGQGALVAGVGKYETRGQPGAGAVETAPHAKLGDLRYAAAEAHTVASHFGTSPLLDDAATCDAVVRGAVGKRHLHLICHGAYAWRGHDPLDSSLYLARSEPLSLRRVLGQWDLSAARLVALSACETGITEVSQSPDESVGLPWGFLQAGASGVVSSLWTVDDRSTSLLMDRFYREHLGNGRSPGLALRLAQMWVRDVTREELLEYYESFIPRRAGKAPPGGPAPVDEADAGASRMTGLQALNARSWTWDQLKPGERPFQQAFFWAPFLLVGA